MIIISWLKGMLIHRWGRLAGSICGIALTIALLASVGIFIVYSGASMTARAISNIPVDWQVQIVPGVDINIVKNAIAKITGYSVLEKTGYAEVSGFEAATGNSVQTTGKGKVLGISREYSLHFPGQIRVLTGNIQGALLAQQTAANLHAKVGDTVTVMRVGLPPVKIRVDGVVDLPNADSLFQAIGLPSGAAPQAPPDNVLLLPIDQWHTVFDAQSNIRPDSVRMQLHVKINHSFPADPNAAYTQVRHLSNNLEARIAGNGIVGDNLAARLAAVREDASYARVLFLFLGLPGVVLAILLTLSITASGSRHREQEQALLRLHGASAGRVLNLASLEAIVVGIGGILFGFVLTFAIVKILIPSVTFSGPAILQWVGVSSAAGIFIAIAAVLYPSWKQVRHTTVSAIRISRDGKNPLWQRLYLDFVILALSALEFYRTASTGYQIVLAPEGVTAIAVNYEAFIGPFCLWLGGVLLAVRISSEGLKRGRSHLARLLNPIAHRLSEPVAATLSRERTFITRGIILLALAVSFAVSTSIFNTTYNAQSRVDAQLTNGSDVTVTGLTPFSRTDEKVLKLKALQDVADLQMMQHRYAYVGNDLQDIYGIDALHIGDATAISNAYFAGTDAGTALSALAKQQDGILVSEETVKDFQLQIGDTINLRLQSTRDHQYHSVPFHFIGVVREFPTAPRDSFLVANAGYIAKVTGNSACEVILLKASGSALKLAGQVERIIGTTGGKVSDIGSAQRMIDTSLTSVDLHGLTALELVFAILLATGSMGLVLAVGLAERRRSFAILTAMGARRSQVGIFIWAEGFVMLLTGSLIGTALGLGIAQMMVKVLTGVFDPPPESLAVPWPYLVLLAVAVTLSMIAAVSLIKAMCRRPAVEEMRNLSQ